MADSQFQTRLEDTGQSNIHVKFGGESVSESVDSIGNWKKSASSFLRLISMNDTALGCPKWNAVFRKPNEAEVPRSWGILRRSRKIVDKPDGNNGFCLIWIDRGVVERNFRVYWMKADLFYTSNPRRTAGSLLSLWLPAPKNEPSPVSFPVHVQQNKSNGCRGDNCLAYEEMWLPASAFGISVPYTIRRAGRTKHYSIFAKWNFQQIPGVDSMMDKFRHENSHWNNVLEELSPSNIAILSLPLLMAIPPISLLATAWYVFATDILAALPLLIKGTELRIPGAQCECTRH